MTGPKTDAKWAAETDPGLLIAALQNRADDRSLRRLACAFARRAWPWLNDERSQRAVVIAEQFAEGLATEVALATAHAAAVAVLGTSFEAAATAACHAPGVGHQGMASWYAARCAANASNTRAWSSTTDSACWFAAMLACEALSNVLFEIADVRNPSHPRWASEMTERRALLCGIVREVFPNRVSRVVPIRA